MKYNQIPGAVIIIKWPLWEVNLMSSMAIMQLSISRVALEQLTPRAELELMTQWDSSPVE